MGGCCTNVYFLEKIVHDVPKSGDLITFSQFLLVSADGFARHFQPSRHGLLKPRVVPITRWMLMVMLFFTLSTLNNRALGYQISVPLHIVFRSGGLFVSMLLGWLVAGKKYNLAQISSIMLVTAGVVMATLSSGVSSKKAAAADHSANYADWLIGIGLLITAMILTAFLGLFQEATYAKYGRQWRESMFYVHFLSLPMFALMSGDMIRQFNDFNASPAINLRQLPYEHLPLSVAEVAAQLMPSIAVPRLWIYLVFNILTQYVCIAGVNRLTSIASSLTVNLILNVRKMLSLIISVWWFGNQMSPMASAGCVLVFVGTLLYSRAGAKARPAPDAAQAAVARKEQ
ncbi:UAA transporter [Thamnocephalis sphaerospora]|uniref:UAA transporter n=1 Tax=Thamnocephalis sphaerospora TaxID=78915 RepID=A0A4P9XMT6_9FUNG|nr:UAA transporter [Thamnocephalis sphaerospora]RKP05468.1 UAA transporter [Thamnocephalis sphaerospora]RKP07206.1 UAA transporter [Thamnocephalis sphaerospora]|eukprot:RKP05267.1 UAA transporter [Thamnocephalis sphaerospora]